MEDHLSERNRHLNLTSSEREILQEIAENDTVPRQRRAQACLLLDEGPEGPAQSPAAVEKQLGKNDGFVRNMLNRIEKHGVVAAVIGFRGEASRRPYKRGPDPMLSPETEQEIAAAFSTGSFTKAELARRYGVSNSTLGKSIKRAEHER